MNELKITPGPWEFREQGDADEFCMLASNGRRWVIAFRVNGELMPEEQRANAQLMASSPDLYEALRPLAEQHVDEYLICHYGFASMEECSHCGPILRARAAMAKARGAPK